MSPRKGDKWEDAFGFAPHRVWVGERADKAGVLYLRWWDAARGNWKWKSLGASLRDEKGRILPHLQAMARAAAQEQYERLTGKTAPAVVAERAPLTLGQTWAAITDHATGLYPHDTPHRKEVARELKHAVRILGADTPWAIIDKARYTQLLRTRVDELVRDGHQPLRGGEITMQRIHAIAAWLRDNERIPADAAIPSSKWKDALVRYIEQVNGGRIPEPHRPRYTLEEMRALIHKSWDVDPRFGLLMALGAELRLGQVARCRRSDLDLERRTFKVPGRGKKRGTVMELTPGQVAACRRALDGYLAALERQCPDYPLFPAGQMTGGRKGEPVAHPVRHGSADPITSTAWRKWLTETEELCGIPHARGRGAYGIRRQAVDAVKAAKISREGLQAHGGWSSSQIPDAIYADQEMEYARQEAMEARAKIRGENVPPTYPETRNPAEGGVREESK